MDNKQRKKLKQLGHHLNPVVMIGDKGVSEAVIAEVQRALHDHELIKIKIAADRDEIQSIANDICQQTQAEFVNKIGKMLIIYRQRCD